MMQTRIMQLKALQNPSPDIINIIKQIYDTPLNNSMAIAAVNRTGGFNSPNSTFTSPLKSNFNQQGGNTISGNIFGGFPVQNQPVFNGSQANYQQTPVASSSIFANTGMYKNDKVILEINIRKLQLQHKQLLHLSSNHHPTYLVDGQQVLLYLNKAHMLELITRLLTNNNKHQFLHRHHHPILYKQRHHQYSINNYQDKHQLLHFFLNNLAKTHQYLANSNNNLRIFLVQFQLIKTVIIFLLNNQFTPLKTNNHLALLKIPLQVLLDKINLLLDLYLYKIVLFNNHHRVFLRQDSTTTPEPQLKLICLSTRNWKI